MVQSAPVIANVICKGIMITKKFIIQSIGLFSIITFIPIIETIFYQYTQIIGMQDINSLAVNPKPVLIFYVIVLIIYSIISISLIYSPELYINFFSKKESGSTDEEHNNNLEQPSVILTLLGIYLIAISISALSEPLSYHLIVRNYGEEGLSQYSWTMHGAKIISNIIQLIIGFIIFFKANSISSLIRVIQKVK
jgi:NADH:ubiquinone oxidoreductase subunit 5 (subunit L)/multisubunit Na+/H+ antiporter MnhA subunit